MRLAIRVRPGARHVRVGGCWDGPRGRALLVAVRARAVNGKANEAVVAALARAFGLRRGEITIFSGHRGRDKVVDLIGDDDTLGSLAEKLIQL